MKVTWYPRNLLIAAGLVIAFTVSLTVAIKFRTGAMAGAVALIVYLVMDVGLTFLPSHWGGARLIHRSDQ